LTVKLTRPTVPSVVRLTLLTSQLPPLVNGQPDVNATLRPEKPVELADKATDGELAVIVPPQLPSVVSDVSVQAELLAPDKRTVLAVAFTPVRRMVVRNPLAVQLAGPDRIEAKADAKKPVTVTVKGKVDRRDGLTGDVTLTLTGLPASMRADAVTVKAGTADFTLNVILPPNVMPGETKGLKLAGTAAPDAKQPNIRVRSREVDLTLVISPPAN
jgi:hypothetical protein